MKKRTFTFLVLLLLFFVSNSFTQQFFFYHFGDRKVLHPKENFISVKFTDNARAESKEMAKKLLGPYSEKTQYFRTSRENNAKSEVVICNLKANLEKSTLNKLMKSLSSVANAEAIGYGYTSGDRIVHYSTNEIIVKFKNNISITHINNLNKLFKTEIIEKVILLQNVYLLKVESNGIEGKDNVFDVSNKYALTSLVEYAQPNFIRSGMLIENPIHRTYESSSHKKTNDPVNQSFDFGNDFIPNDTMLGMMWHIKNTGTNFEFNVPGIPGCDANVISAWDITTGNPNVLIAIVDTGVDTNHFDLKNQLCDRRLWYDAYDNDQTPYDEHYHGTGVSGIALAEGNNIAGTVGISYTCEEMPVRVFGPGPSAFTTDLILAKGLNWAWMHGASVINCSWGGGIATPIITHAIQNAVTAGRSGRGTVVVGGSGNDDSTVIYPASLNEVIGAGGLSPCNERKSKESCDNLGDTLANWGACYGEGMEVVAPCVFIGTTMLLGDWCICGQGTSDSSPITAAIAGLILSKNITLSGDSVFAIICRSAQKVGNYNYNISKRYGLWNNEMGYGRVDARAALDMTVSAPGSIVDQVPPIITIFPPESKVFGSKISFTAEIMDNNTIAGGNNSPRLYYRTIQHAQIQSMPGSTAGGNMYTFTFPVAPYSEGFYYYISAQDQSSVPNTSTYPVGGKGFNPPGNISPPKLMFVRNTETYETTFVSTDVPKVIPSSGVSSQFSVLNNVAGKIVLDVNCTVNIVHSFTADLTLSLISPSGTEIVILSGIGWDSDSLKNTTLDDEALFGIDDTTAVPPYSGIYKPVEKLWLFDGEHAGGQWRMKIVDNGYGDGGILKSWNMKFKFASIDDNVILPGTFNLVRNYPNPFNPKTRIVFNVPRTALVKILVYDISGRLVKTLLNETRTPKLEDYVDFDAGDPSVNNGRGLASGVYFYNLIVDDEFIEARRMVFVK